MKKLRWGSKGPEVRLLQEHLVLLGYSVEIDGVFGGETDGAVRRYQTKHGLLVDGVCGQYTLAAIERSLAETAAAYASMDEPEISRPEWVLRLQSFIDACHRGKVGYYSNPLSDSERAKLPVASKYPAWPVDKPNPKHGTTRSFGCCSHLASNATALLANDATPHVGANGTAPYLPDSIRPEEMKGIKDNVVEPLVDGVHKVQGDGWKPVIEGYADLFDYFGICEWEAAEKVMEDKSVPFAICHLDGGHVICLHTVDQAKGWWYIDPRTAAVVPDGVYVLAADGWSGDPGVPTTILQPMNQRVKKKRMKLYGMMGLLMMEDKDIGLRATIWEGGE